MKEFESKNDNKNVNQDLTQRTQSVSQRAAKFSQDLQGSDYLAALTAYLRTLRLE